MADISDLRKIKYQFEKDTVEPGYYTLHRPSKCNLKFPKNNRPIHKKSKDPYEGKNIAIVPQNDEWRQMIIRSDERILYPAICRRNEFEDIRKKASPLKSCSANKSDPEELRLQAELRKKRLKELQKVQPKLSEEKEKGSKDIQTETLDRATALRDEEFQGARIANQIIMASKCHAIRDAQLVEKSIIAKEIDAENKRLDIIMEEERKTQLEREQRKYEESKRRKKENRDDIKRQIDRIEKLKKEEIERKRRESDLINRTDSAVKEEDVNKANEKRAKARKLKELLDQCNKELADGKRKIQEEEKRMEERIRNFVLQRKERDEKLRSESERKKIIWAKGIDNIAKAQKAEKDLREELANLRLIKAEEDVERQYREKEKMALKKKLEDMKKLQEARDKQIDNIRKQMALEVSIDEEIYKKVKTKTEEDEIKEKQKDKFRQEALLKYKESIIDQIREKEHMRNEKKFLHAKEGRKLLEAIQEEENHEKQVVKRKIAEMIKQNVPSKYVKEAELKLSKLKYI